MEIEQHTAPEFSEELHECKAKEGAAAQFECTVTGTPAPKVQWYKDGKPISAGPNYIIESYDDGRQVLTIYHAKSEDVGHYYCTATNLAGKAETDADLKGNYFKFFLQHVWSKIHIDLWFQSKKKLKN